MVSSELKKSDIHNSVEIIEYLPNAVVSKMIVKKRSENFTASSLDAGEKLTEESSLDYRYIQTIDGETKISICDKSYKLSKDKGIILPIQLKYTLLANDQFNMISTVLKIGYEE